MKGEGLGEEILPNTAHLDCVLGVAWSAVGVGGPEEADGVVAFLDDEHADDLFVAVDDEVPSELVCILG